MSTATTARPADPPVPSPTRTDVRRPTGWLLIGTTVVNVAAVAVLSTVFAWPGVLDEGAAVALPAFAAEQTWIVSAFYAFALASILLVPISLGLHRIVDPTGSRAPLLAPTVTAAGILTGVFQVLGWIRWPLTVPGLADAYLDPAATDAQRTATASSYDLVNAYAGGALGEHLGWLFQAAWGLGIAVLLLRTRATSRVLAVTGAVLTVAWSVPFLLADAVPAAGAGLLGTAGFTAYALWFAWNAALGIALLRARRSVLA
ncbi:MAG TPA: DUF4386 family protein [Geodermatophilus sp.]|nr:DUF4386 family protein [Geodermatophilus sp.]